MREKEIDNWINRLKHKPIVVGKFNDFKEVSPDDGYIVGDSHFLKGVQFPSESFKFVEGAFEHDEIKTDFKPLKLEFSFKTKKSYKLFGFDSVSSNNICRLKKDGKNEYVIEIIFLSQKDENYVRNIKIIMVDAYHSRKYIPLRFKFIK